MIKFFFTKWSKKDGKNLEKGGANE